MKIIHKTTRKERRQKKVAHLKQIKLQQKDGSIIFVREEREEPRTHGKISGIYNSVFSKY